MSQPIGPRSSRFPILRLPLPAPLYLIGPRQRDALHRVQSVPTSARTNTATINGLPNLGGCGGM